MPASSERQIQSEKQPAEPFADFKTNFLNLLTTEGKKHKATRNAPKFTNNKTAQMLSC